MPMLDELIGRRIRIEYVNDHGDRYTFLGTLVDVESQLIRLTEIQYGVTVPPEPKPDKVINTASPRFCGFDIL